MEWFRPSSDPVFGSEKFEERRHAATPVAGTLGRDMPPPPLAAGLATWTWPCHVDMPPPPLGAGPCLIIPNLD
jgi:hypothetical protein